MRAKSPSASRDADDDQAIFQGLFESAPDGIVVVNQQGQIVRVNSQVEKMFGYGRVELLGQPVEVLVPERFRAAHVMDVHRYSSEPRTRQMGARRELYGRRKDGSEFPVDIMLSPLETDQGQLVLSVVRDMTERKRVEQALRQSEEHFRLLVEGVKDYAIFMLGPDGRVTSWNSAAERIKGYRAKEIIGEHFSRFYATEDIERGKPEEELKVAAIEDRFEDEGWRVRKDGSRFWANEVITSLKDEAGNLRGFAKVTRDFTDRKRAEEALLLEITNTLIPNIDIKNLLPAVCATLHAVMPHDHASLSIYDPDSKKLRQHALTGFDDKGVAFPETLEAVEGSLVGWPFATRQPLVLNRMETDRFAPEVIQPWVMRGVRSGCWLPLIHRDRVLGTLAVASKGESAFTQDNVNLLRQVANQVAVALENALAFRQMSGLIDRYAEEKRYLEEELKTEHNFEEIVGRSAALKRVLKQLETVAPTDATVLILGETGTGKELVARAIHKLSARREQTFAKLNCAAIPTGLLESELFGHEKGAFTGAIARKIGRLELAHQGTLFLDEVGDIPLELQPKLLRVLQEKEFERLGSTRTVSVDVRLIAATNRDLAQMAADRQFRSDLYYRLNVFPIFVPPLRDRPEDIPTLVRYFVQKYAKRMDRKIQMISAETMDAFTRWHWPGNVRELGNFIERAVILSQGPTLNVPLAELKPMGKAKLTGKATLEDAEREHIIRVLRETKGVIAGPHGAAARLALNRSTLNSKMRKLGISRKDL